MKKVLIVLSVLIIILVSNTTTDDLIIPDESIRVRVIANSNSATDQAIKKIVRDEISKEITVLLEDVTNIEDARQVIKDNIDAIDKRVKNVLLENNYNDKYAINYGYNLFPSKKYKGVVYKEGYYESVVVTLGNGDGNNWWCVLFPPLCLMETNQDNLDEVEYKSFIKEIIDKYFKN